MRSAASNYPMLLAELLLSEGFHIKRTEWCSNHILRSGAGLKVEISTENILETARHRTVWIEAGRSGRTPNDLSLRLAGAWAGVAAVGRAFRGPRLALRST